MPHPKLMAAPPTGSFKDRQQAVLGFDPHDTLDKLRAAQQATAFLRKEEARLAAEVASYRARFAYPSHFEHERKAMLSRLTESFRREAQVGNEKITNGQLDSMAHANTEYQGFLGEAYRQRQTLERLEADLIRVRGEIETARGVEVYYERLARTNESLIFHSGREAGL